VARLRLALGALAGAAAARRVGRVFVQVFDATGVPIKGVKVTATGAHVGNEGDIRRLAYTDDDGGVLIDGLPVGLVTVVSRAARLKVTHAEVTIAEGETTEMLLVMDVGDDDDPRPH
jgi:hypothetical protein